MPVYQRLPSRETAGSCGKDPETGTSHSLMTTDSLAAARTETAKTNKKIEIIGNLRFIYGPPSGKLL
jgi:hypothetical protein